MSEGTGKGLNPLAEGGMIDCVATVGIVEDVTTADDEGETLLVLYDTETEPEPSCAMAKGTETSQQKKCRITFFMAGKEEE